MLSQGSRGAAVESRSTAKGHEVATLFSHSKDEKKSQCLDRSFPFTCHLQQHLVLRVIFLFPFLCFPQLGSRS